MKTLNGFKQFILRGNVVDLAVGVVIGAAFSGLINALVKDILTPFIGAIAKIPDFSNLYFSINGSKFLYGDFLNVLISFFIIAATVYFLVILPINTLVNKTKKDSAPVEPNSKKCPECLSEIPIEATRCAHCTTKIS
ncbi:MAG: large conductance mechanosensitive channel protein MscL [Candidatus Paceibacterota bacterium]|jgi:large conductance mechanosensitive channel